MPEESVPRSEVRVSDSERELAVERLQDAVGEGLLTLAEFEELMPGVLAARTREELARHLAHVPGAMVPEQLSLETRASKLHRGGRWLVPRSLTVTSRAASVRLDFTQARISATDLDLVIMARSSSVTLVLPPGAAACLDELVLTASTVSSRVPDRGGSFRVALRGSLTSSTVRVRYQRRFLWRRW